MAWLPHAKSATCAALKSIRVFCLITDYSSQALQQRLFDFHSETCDNLGLQNSAKKPVSEDCYSGSKCSPVIMMTGVCPTKNLKSGPYCLAHLLIAVWELNGTFSCRQFLTLIQGAAGSLQGSRWLRSMPRKCKTANLLGAGYHRSRPESVQVHVGSAIDCANYSCISAPAMRMQRSQLVATCICMPFGLGSSTTWKHKSCVGALPTQSEQLSEPGPSTCRIRRRAERHWRT